jgi:ABC-2 type transport system permease protein
MKILIRLLAFFWKELHEIRRQPGLILSLILGPFLILLLFGLGYTGQHPPLRVDLVVPRSIANDTRIQQIETIVHNHFVLINTYTDETPALKDLKAGKIDVIESLPADLISNLEAQKGTAIKFVYDTVDPQKAQYIQYISYVQLEEINNAILLSTISGFQQNASQFNQQIATLLNNLDAISSSLTAENIQKTQASLQILVDTLNMLTSNPAYESILSILESQNPNYTQQIQQLIQDLNTLNDAIKNGTVDQQKQLIQSLIQRLTTLKNDTQQLQNISPTVVIAPVKETYTNLRGDPVDLIIYYTPGVFALILQHIAVSLGALSLVRERERGSLEFFGVAPISMLQVLVGKYLAYLLFLGIIVAVLMSMLVFLLHLPFMGSLVVFLLFTLLFSVASVGIGFLISVISRSENQAIQASMLVLLLTVFFSGFLIPLEYFRQTYNYIGYVVPMTQGNIGFIDILLRGEPPGQIQVEILGIIAAVSFLLVVIIWGRQFRRLNP